MQIKKRYQYTRYCSVIIKCINRQYHDKSPPLLVYTARYCKTGNIWEREMFMIDHIASCSYMLRAVANGFASMSSKNNDRTYNADNNLNRTSGIFSPKCGPQLFFPFAKFSCLQYYITISMMLKVGVFELPFWCQMQPSGLNYHHAQSW